MKLNEIFLNRRSGRKYTTDPVPEESLNAILHAGLLAPSSRNLKSTELISIQNREMLEALSTVKVNGGAMLKNAGCAIIVIGNSDLSDAWIEDASIAMTYMMLKATELRIANCWVQCRNRFSNQTLDNKPLSADEITRTLCRIPANYSVLAILSLGLPAENLPAHSPDQIDLTRLHTESFGSSLNS